MPAPAPASTSPSAEDLDLQLMWVSMVRRPWSSLALVPTEAPLLPYFAAGALAEVGSLHDLAGFETIDAVNASGDEGLRLARLLEERVAGGKRVVALVAPLSVNLSGLPLVEAAERVLLLLRYGSSKASARATLDLVGHERVIGAVALRAER